MENRLGRLIRQRRKELGLTQEQVEERSGVSQHYQSQIERGKVDRPGDAFLESLATTLHLSMQDIRRAQGWVVEGDTDERSVRFAGTMPADSVRWCEVKGRDEYVRVWTQFLGTHAPERCFVVQASGDCLLAHGIRDGRYVLLREPDDHEVPRNGTVVAVRIGDDFSLKLWYKRDGRLELTDGDGRVVYRGPVDDASDLILLGIYLNDWAPVEGMR